MLTLRKLPMFGVGALVVVILAGGCSGSAGDSAKGVDVKSSQVRLSATRGSAARAGVRLVKVGDFDAPVYATGAPGEGTRLFVVEKAGRIALVANGRRLATPFLDISREVGSTGHRASQGGLDSVGG